MAPTFYDESDAQVVCINVGGTFFTTQLGTLRVHKGSNLANMFTPPFPIHQDNRDGSFFIDRNGSVFGLILDYLRTGTLVVPRDPVEYVTLRREVRFYGLPVALQLPNTRPLSWQSAPERFKHARIVIDELEKTVEWEEGSLPPDLHQRTVFDMVRFFTARGYKIASEYTSRGARGFISIWLVKAELFPGTDVALEITNEDVAAAMAAAQQAAQNANTMSASATAAPRGATAATAPSSASYAQPKKAPAPGPKPTAYQQAIPRPGASASSTPAYSQAPGFGPSGATPRGTPLPQQPNMPISRTPTGTPNAQPGGYVPSYGAPSYGAPSQTPPSRW